MDQYPFFSENIRTYASPVGKIIGANSSGQANTHFYSHSCYLSL